MEDAWVFGADRGDYGDERYYRLAVSANLIRSSANERQCDDASDRAVRAAVDDAVLLEDSPLGTLQFLFNSANLTTWNSANSYVQVDSGEGYPLSKTANLGGLTIPPNPKLSLAHDLAYRQITLGAGRLSLKIAISKWA